MIELGYISISKAGQPTLWLNEMEEWSTRDNRAIHEKIAYHDKKAENPEDDISFIPSSENAIVE